MIFSRYFRGALALRSTVQYVFSPGNASMLTITLMIVIESGSIIQWLILQFGSLQLKKIKRNKKYSLYQSCSPIQVLVQVSSVHAILSKFKRILFFFVAFVFDSRLWAFICPATRIISIPCCWGSVCRECIHPFSIPLRVAGDHTMLLFPTRNLQLSVYRDQHISKTFL